MRASLSLKLGSAIGMAVVLVVLLASCGSGDAPEAKVISPSEFLTKAQPICKKGNDKIDKSYNYWGGRAHLHADSEDFMNRVAEKVVIPVRQQQLKELRALGSPEGEEKKLKAFLEAMEEGIEEGKKDRRTLREGHYAFQRAFNIAASLDLEACFIG
jgi:hypothetical protein